MNFLFWTRPAREEIDCAFPLWPLAYRGSHTSLLSCGEARKPRMELAALLHRSEAGRKVSRTIYRSFRLSILSAHKYRFVETPINNFPEYRNLYNPDSVGHDGQLTILSYNSPFTETLAVLQVR